MDHFCRVAFSFANVVVVLFIGFGLQSMIGKLEHLTFFVFRFFQVFYTTITFPCYNDDDDAHDDSYRCRNANSVENQILYCSNLFDYKIPR